MKIIKWVGIGLGVIVGLAVLIAGILYGLGWSKLNKVYSVSPSTLTVTADDAAIERGRHLVENVSACTGCHGADLSGDIFLEIPPIGTFPALNLTAGDGGVGQVFDDSDWERAIRHGADPEGKTLMFMPSHQYAAYSDADTAAIIAYLKSVPPVDHTLPPRSLTPLGMLMLGLGAFDAELRAEVIAQAGPPAPTPPPDSTAEYGQYLATVSGCSGCHGEGLVGRPPEAAEQGPPAGPNLTRGGELIGWTEADFVTAMRAGTTPGGRVLNDEMPWRNLGRMTDEELHALWLYLQSLPAQPTPQQ